MYNLGMKMKSISGLVFYVADLDKTADFYEKLGFRFGKDEPGRRLAYLNWFWIEFRKQDPGFNDKPGGQYVYIKVEDAKQFYEGLLKYRFKPVSKPTDLPYNRHGFRLTDPDGYQLVFFQ